MKVRDSGMPSKEMWEGFFESSKILRTLELNDTVRNAAEFGCGYGTFTIPAAEMIKGTLYTFDIEDEMVLAVKQEAEKKGLKNIHIDLRDFVAVGTGLEDKSVDYAMLFNILHIEKPEILLQEACRILQPEGKLTIIHWNFDSSTPRGPSMDIRPKPEQCIQWAQEAGFGNPKQYDLKPYHYGIVMKKREGAK